MRKLTAAAFQSLDGVIQGGGGPEEDPSGGFRFGGWTVPFTDDSADAAMSKIYDEPDYDLLLGKRTYDIFSAYWPSNQDVPIGAKFQRINKYVLTHSDEPLTWENSVKLGQQHHLSAAAGGRADRPPHADDLPGGAGRRQAHLHGLRGTRRTQARRSFRVG